MSNWELLKWMKFAIFQWFLSMVGVDMDMVHTYSYTPHMFCNCFVSVVYSFQNHRKVWGAWSTPPSLQGTVSYHHCSDNAIIAIRSIHDISHKTTWKYYRFLTQAYIILHLHPFFLSFSEVTSSVNLTCWHHLSLPGPPRPKGSPCSTSLMVFEPYQWDFHHLKRIRNNNPPGTDGPSDWIQIPVEIPIEIYIKSYEIWLKSN